MKKYLYLFVVSIALLNSCKHKSETVTISKDSLVVDTAKRAIVKKRVLKYYDPLLIQYARFIDSLDTINAYNATNAAKQYNLLFKGHTNSTCDTAFVIFDKYYRKLADNLEQIHSKDTTLNLDPYYGYVDKYAKKPIPENILRYVADLKTNGFMLDEEEGDIYIGQDRDFIVKWFYEFVSPVMKDYLIESNKENKNMLMNDGSITISPLDFVDRVVWWENFENKHKDFICYDDVLGAKQEYLKILLMGSDNTEVLEYGEDMAKVQMSDYFKKAYSYLERKYPLTEACKWITPYYKMLLNGDKKKADELIKSYQKSGVLTD